VSDPQFQSAIIENFWMRWFSRSATYRKPFASAATPETPLNCPPILPLVPDWQSAAFSQMSGVTGIGKLRSGEDVTILPATLQVDGGRRNVRVAYVARGKGSIHGEFIVFFFHNGGYRREIGADIVPLITGGASKMFN
jgi:hypothetical protein